MAPVILWTCALAVVALTALGRSCSRPQHQHERETSHEVSQAVQEETKVQLSPLPVEPVGQFPFLKLPPEIRNIIYRLMLVDIDYKGQPYRPRLLAFQQPALTRVNQQIRQETLLMFFSHNTFVLRVPSPSHNLDIDHVKEEQQWMRFLRRLKLFAESGNLPTVRHLTIEYIDRGPRIDISGQNLCIAIKCCRQEVKRPNFEEEAGKLGMHEVVFRSIWQYMTGTRVGDEYTSWDDADAVDEALTTAIEDFARMFHDMGSVRVAENWLQMSVGCLVEALHALFQKQGSHKRCLYLNASGRHPSSPTSELTVL